MRILNQFWKRHYPTELKQMEKADLQFTHLRFEAYIQRTCYLLARKRKSEVFKFAPDEISYANSPTTIYRLK